MQNNKPKSVSAHTEWAYGNAESNWTSGSVAFPAEANERAGAAREVMAIHADPGGEQQRRAGTDDRQPRAFPGRHVAGLVVILEAARGTVGGRLEALAALAEIDLQRL